MTTRTPSIAGHVDVLSRDRVAGWAADKNNPTSNLQIIVSSSGTVVAREVARLERPDLKSAFEGSTGNYGFDMAFDPPLSLWRSHAVEIVANGNLLTKGTAILDAIGDPNAIGDAVSSVQPIIVTTTGRSGSSLLMSRLANHTDIVVGGPHPHEVKLLIYYSLALMLHISEADRVKSLDPNLMTVSANRYSIGRNPFNDQRFSQHPAISTYWQYRLPTILKETFCTAIIEYYNAQNVGLGRPSFRYFAEKMHPQHELRSATKFLFPGTRELLLVRDPRDTLCSYNKFWGASLPDGIRLISDHLQRISEIKSEEKSLVVRYEDLVLQEEQTIQTICRYLGLPPTIPFSQRESDKAFRTHGTSKSAFNSIGRWKSDLDEETKAATVKWTRFLEDFGYGS